MLRAVHLKKTSLVLTQTPEFFLSLNCFIYTVGISLSPLQILTASTLKCVVSCVAGQNRQARIGSLLLSN